VAAVVLLPNEVHVWCSDPTLLEDEGKKRVALGLLSADERERHARFVFERDKCIYLTTHALARIILSRYEPIAPRDWRFSVGSHGKPEIAGPGASLRFNLSNTHGLVVCAVTREADVGVDVERLDREAPLDIAGEYFAPSEVAALEALVPSERPARFFDYWTLKESYIKARGLGLSLPLEQFSFTIVADRPPVLTVDAALGDDGASWQFAQHRPTANHLLALCVRRDPRDRDFSVTWQPLVAVP
jgi:4'-phosphopantetheinyl transferase